MSLSEDIMDGSNELMIAWSTCETEADATRLANGAVEQGLAACTQISGPVNSIYRWKGELESCKEYRLMFKLPGDRLDALHQWLMQNHPYETPQFYAVKADFVDPAYLDWVAIQD